MTSSTMAIMQPYFIPYAGYFRLFAASDLFVIYDCVQFPRRGWVHRNKLIEMVAPDDLAEQIVELIQKNAHTAAHGDGVIVVTDITQSIRIRTGEQADAAL